MPKKHIRISHSASETTLAEGPVGWGITPFEGNYYISRKYLLTHGFKPNYIPGLCPYKFLYVWLDLNLENGEKVRNLGWLYWLPNPLRATPDRTPQHEASGARAARLLGRLHRRSGPASSR